MPKLDLVYGDAGTVCVPAPYALALELAEHIQQALALPGGRLAYGDARPVLRRTLDLLDAVPVYDVDDNGEPIRFLNSYECDGCGCAWTDAWSATCDDRCPECNVACSPVQSDDLEPES
ncbi:MAG TPA: hypothetical protein VG407_05945 [Caulobacteraceae bacterium]|jgi:hypothetical protein|nr:hypothetical protein [Caulobacteraceae bacterium]